MALTFDLVEPSIGEYLPAEPFGLKERGVAIHEIMRLLTGSVNVDHTTANKIIKLTNNELRIDRSRSANPQRVLSILFEEETSLEAYTSFVVSATRRNLAFFSQLRNELTLCLVCKREGRFTESFLYLYRILEFVSMALPLLYASTQRGFAESHAFLKSLVADEKGTELKALERAMPVMVGGSDLRLLNFDFSISGQDLGFVRLLKRQFQEKVAPQVKGMDFEREGDILFTVPFMSMSAFMVSLRNRMFHYKIGQKNIDLAEIGGAERVVALCLGELTYWFALTFTEMVRALAGQAVRQDRF